VFLKRSRRAGHALIDGVGNGASFRQIKCGATLLAFEDGETGFARLAEIRAGGCDCNDRIAVSNGKEIRDTGRETIKREFCRMLHGATGNTRSIIPDFLLVAVFGHPTKLFSETFVYVLRKSFFTSTSFDVHTVCLELRGQSD